MTSTVALLDGSARAAERLTAPRVVVPLWLVAATYRRLVACRPLDPCQLTALRGARLSDSGSSVSELSGAGLIHRASSTVASSCRQSS